jgi:diguanylate cyclase (GGDEF)-like protein
VPVRRSLVARSVAWLRPARFHPVHLPALCGLALAIAVALGAWLVLSDTRSRELAGNARRLESFALVLAEQTDRAFQALELVETAVIEQMRSENIVTEEGFDRAMSTSDTYRMLRDRIAALPHVDALSLINRDGETISTSRFWPAADISVTDRRFYQVLLADRTMRSYLDGPVLNPATHTWSISFTRKFTAPDGEVLGFVHGVMQVDYFERFYASIGLDQDGAISLISRDSVLLARFPPADAALGRAFGSQMMSIRALNGQDHGAVRTISVIDGQDRYFAVRALTHYPAAVTVSATVKGTLADWHAQARYLTATAALLILFIAGIVLLSARYLRNQHLLVASNAAKAEADAARSLAEAQLQTSLQRERVEHELRLEQTRFGTALSNMSQALCMFDGSARLVVSNSQYARLLGLPHAEVVPGTLLSELLGGAVARNALTRNDAEQIYQHCIGVYGSGVATTFSLATPDGRFYVANHQPMAGNGWLATCEDVTDRRQAEAKIVHMAHHDALTGLPNRLSFRERLTTVLARARRGPGCAVLSLDLDRFKQVNEALGHPMGDILLRTVAARLLAAVRDVDTVARVGGDEFAVILNEVVQPQQIIAVATRLLETLGRPYEVGVHQVVISASIGISLAPQDASDPDDLLKQADLALYRAKSEGAGAYRFFEPEMDARMQARRLLEIALRKAVVRQEFEVHYQPMINLQTGAVSGFEALVRWRQPHGLVPPGEFIPLAEETGLIVPLGEFVLRRACVDAVTWGGGLTVAVNLSPVQFRGPSIVAVVADALAASGLPATQLELEITETVMLQDTDMTLDLLRALKQLGVHISMDDFGTGYSSLSYLRRFPFDKIKIDQSFVRDLGTNPDCVAIIRAVANLGHSLGMATTAEGVETQDQLDRLRVERCTEVQGYLFSPPCPAAEVPALLRRLRTPEQCRAAEVAQLTDALPA